jgi:predicted HD superfamily hydrolase involved in NAD metabolism
MSFDLPILEQLIHLKLSRMGPRGERRFRHCHSVAKKMLELAHHHELKLDDDVIMLTGLIHDYAKYTTMEEFRRLALKYPEINEHLEAPMKTLHALCGPYVIMEELGITDEAILRAVAYHTTGHPVMDDLGELVFLSDFTEENRVGEIHAHIRTLSEQSIKKAVAWILHDTLEYINQLKQPLHPLTVEAYVAYQQYL